MISLHDSMSVLELVMLCPPALPGFIMFALLGGFYWFLGNQR